MSNGFWAMQLFCFIIAFVCFTSVVASIGKQNKSVFRDLGLALLLTIAVMAFANFVVYTIFGKMDYLNG